MSVVKPKGVLSTPKLGAVKLYSKVVIGASGAVSSQTSAASSGFTVSRAAAGRYDILTDHTWADVLHFDVKRYNQGTVKGSNPELFDKYGATTAKTLTISIVSDTGAEEDPASGDELWIELTLANTNVGP